MYWSTYDQEQSFLGRFRMAIDFSLVCDVKMIGDTVEVVAVVGDGDRGQVLCAVWEITKSSKTSATDL